MSSKKGILNTKITKDLQSKLLSDNDGDKNTVLDKNDTDVENYISK